MALRLGASLKALQQPQKAPQAVQATQVATAPPKAPKAPRKAHTPYAVLDHWGSPREPGRPYSIIDALHDLSEGRQGTLMLVKTSTGEGFKVKSLDSLSKDICHVTLTGENGQTFRPKVGPRESTLYAPVWR